MHDIDQAHDQKYTTYMSCVADTKKCFICFSLHRADRWGYLYPCFLRSWVAECIGARHVLWIMWMAHPNQASRPQGYHHVNGDTLAANDSGIGSGWQQSKQN